MSPGALLQTSFGDSVVTTDVDHDGLAEIVVGAPWAGKVYVYAGSPIGPRDPARQAIVGEHGAWFPYRLVSGDFNRDGYGDVAIVDGGLGGPVNPIRGPQLTIYPGSPSGLSARPTLVVRLADL